MNKFMICLLCTMILALAACGGQSADSESIIGTTWKWQMFEDSGDVNNVTVPDPANYTLTLNEDGTASIKADCNQVSWTYEIDGSRLTFNTLGPSTLAMCAEDSLDTVYLQRLGDTTTYVTSEGQLYLNLKADAGNMVFTP